MLVGRSSAANDEFCMEETHSAKAIILDKKPFREYDAIVSVFCLDKGRLDLVARGAKKSSSKLAGHIEPITLSNIMIARGRRYDYLAAAINENSFINIKNDFDKINTAGRAINIFKKLIKENEKDENLFYLLCDFLNILNSSKPPPTLKLRGASKTPAYAEATEGRQNLKLFFPFFTLKLLTQSGYRPELHDCVICKKKIVPNNNKFDLFKGGAVCGGCGRGGKNTVIISDNCIKALRIVINSDFEKLIKLKIDNKLEKEVEKIINAFYKYNF